MHLSIVLGLYALLALAVYKIASIAIGRWRHAGDCFRALAGPSLVNIVLTMSAARAKELGCLEAPEYPDQGSSLKLPEILFEAFAYFHSVGFLGLGQIRTMQEADKKRMFPDLMISRQNDMSKLTGRVCSTFKFHLLGKSQSTVFTGVLY